MNSNPVCIYMLVSGTVDLKNRSNKFITIGHKNVGDTSTFSPVAPARSFDSFS